MSEPPNNPPPSGTPEGYVFIVTYGRSGSTLLQNLLNQIDGYCIRGENNNALFHIARAWDAVAHSGEMAKRRKAARESGTSPIPSFGTSSDPWYGAEISDCDAFGRGLVDGFVRAVLSPEPGTRIAGFKEIRYHTHKEFFDTYLDFMSRFFPRARFIFNTRDLDAVAKSGWWAQMNPQAVRKKLEPADRLFRNYAERNQERCLMLHYDDYNGHPEELRPLLDFLGEPFDVDLVSRVMTQRLDHMRHPGEIGT